MKTKNIQNGLKKGFTLIELLVVISITGILSAVLLANLVGIRERAADVRLKGELKSFKSALRLYYNDFQEYPDTGTLPVAGSEFNDGSVTVYMKQTPEYDSYEQVSNGDGFLLGVVLNNISDGDIAKSVEDCAVSDPVESTFYVCED